MNIISGYLKKNKDTLITGLIVAIVSVMLTHYFDEQLIKKEHELYDSNDTEEELLLKAQDYYKLGQYDKVVEVYRLEKLDHNPLAMNNLAYFYVEGIYLDKDISKAKELYKRAFKLDENYIEGYFMIVIDHPEKWSEVLDVMDQGARLECSSTLKFLSYMYKDKAVENQRAYEYLKMERGEKEKFLLANTEKHFEWRKDKLEENDFIKKKKKMFYRKENVGTYIDSNGDVKPLYGTVIYTDYGFIEFVFASRVCKYSFIMIDQNNENGQVFEN